MNPITAQNTPYLKVYLKRKRIALSFEEWQRFLVELNSVSIRDSIMARCLFTAWFLESVQQLSIYNIDFSKNSIKYRHKDEYFTVQYPSSFMDELKRYIEDTTAERGSSDLVFVTCHGKRVVRSRLNYSLEKASKNAGIKHVTPYSIRATYYELITAEGQDESLFLTMK